MEGSICCTVRSMMRLPRSREDRNAASFSLMISLICPRIRKRVNHNISGSSPAQLSPAQSAQSTSTSLFVLHASITTRLQCIIEQCQSHCASCHHSCQGNIDHPRREGFKLTNVPYWAFISVTQLQLYVWNSQRSCCQGKQAGTSLKSSLHFRQRVRRRGQAVLARNIKSYCSFRATALLHRTCSPW